jgi:hypothetical protein
VLDLAAGLRRQAGSRPAFTGVAARNWALIPSPWRVTAPHDLGGRGRARRRSGRPFLFETSRHLVSSSSSASRIRGRQGLPSSPPDVMTRAAAELTGRPRVSEAAYGETAFVSARPRAWVAARVLRRRLAGAGSILETRALAGGHRSHSKGSARRPSILMAALRPAGVMKRSGFPFLEGCSPRACLGRLICSAAPRGARG